MSSRRKPRKVLSPELKSESSLSSIQSSEEVDKSPDIQSPTEASPSVQVAQGRKRRAEASTVAVPNGKRIKTTKTTIVEEDTPERPIATSSKIRKSRTISKNKSEVEGDTLEKTITKTKVLETKPTTSAKRSRVVEHTIAEGSATANTPKRTRKAKKEVLTVEQLDGSEAGEKTPKKAKRHRKTKEEKEAEAMPLAARSNGLRMFIGAHVSCAKGVYCTACSFYRAFVVCSYKN